MKTKNLILMIFMATMPFLLSAQNPLDKMFEKYSGKDGFYFIDLKTNLMSPKDDEGNKTYDKVINLKMISFDAEQNKSYSTENLYEVFFSSVDKTRYKGVIDVKSSGENMEMLIRKEGDQLAEVIIAVQEENEITIIAAAGNFDMKDLSQFEQMQKCHGMQMINKLCEE